MSWYIETLLRSSLEIKSKADIESDEYNDLVLIEKRCEDLHDAGIITDYDISLISYMEDGKPLVNSKEGFGKNRISLSKDFVSLCNKIAFYLGGYFTDEGYVDYMKTKYRLTDDQVGQMLDYMKSKYKNKLIRKQKKINE